MQLRLTALLALLVAISVFAIWIWRNHADTEDGEHAAADNDQEQAMPAEAISTVGTQAPPQASELIANAPPAEKPTPPEGYTFPESRGEMASAPLDRTLRLPKERAASQNDAWLTAPDAIPRLVEQAREAGRDRTFGFARLAVGADAHVASDKLAMFGARVLGASGAMLRLELPGDSASLRRIDALAEIDGLASVPISRKLSATFLDEANSESPSAQAPVFVTLMTHDPDGRWRTRLEGLGTVVGRYHDNIRVYEANIPYGHLEAVALADFVLAVEPIGTVTPAHDNAVPGMGADVLRRFRASSGSFTGNTGANVPIGVMDTGLNTHHVDIAANRASICGANFITENYAVEQDDLWFDGDGHGTHVTGTILGAGHARPEFAGMAPGVRHVRFAKVLGVSGGGTANAVLAGIDWMSKPSGCSWEGRRSEAIKPLVVNMSLSTAGTLFEGRTTGERKLDAAAWGSKQLYVVAQANSNTSKFSNYGAAKNSLSVGAVADNGNIAHFSSHGPTADGRLAPQVSGVGVDIHSALGNGSRTGYASKGGTSMAAPAVAGVAALVMDAMPDLRNHPAAVRAVLMATSIKPQPVLDEPARYPRDNTGGPGAWQTQYGLGKVSARAAVLNRNVPNGWSSGYATATPGDGYRYVDIDVPEGTSRLDIVATWDEPPADATFESVLNDIDLYVDSGRDCPTSEAKCGEYSSRSSRDNVEWVIVPNPKPGVYRAKLVADQTYTDYEAAVAWNVVRGEATPQLSITEDRSEVSTPNGGEFEVELTVSNDAYIASGVTLQVACRRHDDEGELRDCASMARYVMAPNASEVEREDGLAPAITDLPHGTPFTSPLALGEVAAGESQSVRLVFRTPRWYRSYRLFFIASAWNAQSDTASVAVTMGRGTAPDDVQQPAHARFDQAMAIDESRDSASLDFLLAAREAGEPLNEWDEPALSPPKSFVEAWRRWGWPSSNLTNMRSLWFKWVAPRTANQLHWVWIEQDRTQDAAPVDVRWDFYVGESIGTLRHLLSEEVDERGLAGKVKEGDTLFVRLSALQSQTEPLRLHWESRDLTAPDNDNLAAAKTLSGTSGSIKGNNLGATLEQGEDWSGLAATVWHRWTAPDDGHWEFDVDTPAWWLNLRVLVFEGSNVRSMRLVSGDPRTNAKFLARKGRTYRIAVSAQGGETRLAGTFTLSWRNDPKPNNAYHLGFAPDHLAGARTLSGDQGSYGMAGIFYLTVQPDEPVETGTRTRWFSWTPSEDGRYVWRLADAEIAPTQMRLTAFRGAQIDDLELMSASDPQLGARPQLVFSAKASEVYSVSVGLTGAASYGQRNVSGLLQWGPTPANDDLAGAISLSGASGEIETASSEYATLEVGEPTKTRSHRSQWYEWRATDSGWHSVRLEGDSAEAGDIAVFLSDGDGAGDLELVGTSDLSQGLNGAVEVRFRARPGQRYVIRIGTALNSTGDTFNLVWGRSNEPLQLRYVGRVADGDEALLSKSFDLRWPGQVTFNTDGDELYIAGEFGLSVFARNQATGGLTPIEFIWNGELGCDGQDCNYLYVGYRTPLLWDSVRSRLYAMDRFYSSLHKLVPGGAGQGLTHRAVVTGVEPPLGAQHMLMGEQGEFLHMLRTSTEYASELHTFAWTNDGQLEDVEVQTSSEAPNLQGLRHAVVSADGEYFYAVTPEYLLTFERDTATGKLSLMWRIYWNSGSPDLTWVGLNSGETALGALSRTGLRFWLWDVQDDLGHPATPSFGRFNGFADDSAFHEPISPSGGGRTCTGALPRGDSLSLDVFCEDFAYTLTWDADEERLYATDYLAHWQADRYGNEIPAFGRTRSAAASPDGKHVYVTGSLGDQVLIFERIGGLEPPEEQ